MRNFLAIMCFILGMSSIHAQPYFCASQGTQLEYVRTGVKSGKTVYTHLMSINSVTSDAEQSSVDYESDFHKPNGSQMYGGPVKLKAVISRSQDVVVDPGEAMASVFHNMFPSAKVVSEGGKTTLPSELTPGQTLQDASCTVSFSGFKYRTEITERKVLRTESVTTPAGTYDCVVVSEHKIEKGPGRNRETTALTWYARGIGMVRHDTYNRNMVLETSEILNKFVPSRK